MDEDCLFMDVYSPTNATTTSNLPIMVFIQGGGWTSDSNGNFNGSLLVQNSGMAMMVVTINYRVGLLGALASKEILAGASVNNGLKDGKVLHCSAEDYILIQHDSNVCIAMGTRSCRSGEWNLEDRKESLNNGSVWREYSSCGSFRVSQS